MLKERENHLTKGRECGKDKRRRNVHEKLLLPQFCHSLLASVF